jgi:hypothetical protein
LLELRFQLLHPSLTAEVCSLGTARLIVGVHGGKNSFGLAQRKRLPQMTAAQAHEYNMWVTFLVVGLPLLVVFGGGLILHMAIALAALALFFSHPAIAIVLAVLWLFPWRWFWAAFAVGEGLKLSGVFGRLHRRRPRFPRRRDWSQSELDRHDR